MPTPRTHAFNIFVIDAHDQPIPGAEVTMLVGGTPAVRATTSRRKLQDGSVVGVANTPIVVVLPAELTDVRVQVKHADQVQEQQVDLDAPNLTFRFDDERHDAPAVEEAAQTARSPESAVIDVKALRQSLLREFSRADLDVLCQDIAAMGELDGFSLDHLPPGGLEYQAGELIRFFQRRAKLALLLDAVERARPGFIARMSAGGVPPTAPPAAKVARPVTVTPSIRLAEVPTAIYELLLKDNSPLVSVAITNQQPSAFAGSLSVAVQRFSDEEVHDVDLDGNQTGKVDLHPVLQRTPIDALQEIERVTLLIRLDAITGQNVSRKTASLYLLPRSAAPLSVKDLMTGTWRDLRPYLGGFVTPQAKAVQEFLPRVRAHVAGGQLLGYGAAPSAIEPQVRAVFEALKAWDMGYVHSTLVFNRHEDWSRQRLRLPSETLRTKNANCLDGAVLVASILEAFGLSSALVFTGAGDSAHAFVGWETSQGSNTWSHMETNGFTTTTFADARVSADAKAVAFNAVSATALSPIFSRLSIRDLRAQGINPLE